jgi:hypothetical protein
MDAMQLALISSVITHQDLKTRADPFYSVIDPILCDLLDPSIKWKVTTTVINGKELPAFAYERPVDQRYITYLIEILLAVSRFGGQSFIKILQSTQVRRSSSSRVVELVKTGLEITIRQFHY